jgi:hypothetical protein
VARSGATPLFDTGPTPSQAGWLEEQNLSLST